MQAGYINSDWGMAGWYDREEYNDNMTDDVENLVGRYIDGNSIKWLQDHVSASTWDSILEDLNQYAETKIQEQSANARAEYEYNKKYD